MGSDTKRDLVPKHGINPPIAKNIVRAWLAEYGDENAPVTARRRLGEGLIVHVHQATGYPGHYEALRALAADLGFTVRIQSDNYDLGRYATRKPEAEFVRDPATCPHNLTVRTGRSDDETFMRCLDCGARYSEGR